MFSKIKSLLGKAPEPEQPEMPDVGAIVGITPHLPMLGLSGFGLSNGSYDNTFPSISRIADAIAEVQPIAINARGEEVKNAHLLEVLNRPNKEMCSVDFMETLAVMLLVHPKVHLLAWRHGDNGELEAGGEITEQNLAGLTFMEGVSERIVNGRSEYGINGKVFTDKEVLSLSLAVNPYHLADGYSPSVASKKWATTDDYIAEFHNAQFRNNARPAGMLTIVADSVEEFNDAVDTIEAKFRGASNAGNTIYNMRPSQTLDGKPAPAKIEWTPFAQTNKDLTLEPVYNQANRKLESVFGVPEEVRGHVQNSTYASAEVADYIFSRRVIYPMLVKIYAKMTHELNRITGGLGYALSFHYEVPMLTDTRKLQAEALKTMIDAGFSVESSVEALRLPESYKGLKLATPPKPQKALLADNSAQAGEVKLERSDNVAEHAVADKPAKSAMRPEPTASEHDKANNEEDELPAGKEDLVSPNLLVAYDDMTAVAVRNISDALPSLLEAEEAGNLEHQLDILEDKLERDFQNDTDLQQDIKEITTDLDGLRRSQTIAQEKALTSQLGVEVNYTGTDIKERVADLAYNDLYDSYRTMIHNLLNATALIIYNKKDDATEQDLGSELEQLGQNQHWRSVRFGFTEQQLVLAITAQMLWEWAQKEYNFKGYKTWHISPLSPAPCEDCLKINGEQVKITENFSNGIKYPPLHPNCYCYLTYSTERTGKQVGRVERSGDAADRRSPAGRAASEGGKECEAAGQADAIGEACEPTTDAQQPIKIACPKCGRFLMDASQVKIEKMICPNSKCKARLAINTMQDGAISACEIKEER